MTTPDPGSHIAASPKRLALAALLLAAPALAWSQPSPVRTTLDSTGDVGKFSAIAIGAGGRPVISYFDATNFQLKVARCLEPTCASGAVAQIVDSAGNVGQFTSIAIGGDGLPVVSYYDAGNLDLKVAHCDNADCSASTVRLVAGAGDTGEFSSIAKAADGLPVIAFTLGGLGGSSAQLAKCSTPDCSGATTILTPDPAAGGQHTSIAVGPDGIPSATYVADAFTQFKLMRCTTSACTAGSNSIFQAGIDGRVDNSIAIGLDGFPVVSYYDPPGSPALLVRRCASVDCVLGSPTGGIVDNTAADVGAYNDIAIGTDGIPVMSYWNASAGTLRVAQCANATCAGASRISTVDAAGVVGSYTSIAIGADGFPVISYYDTTRADLKVAKCFTRDCETLFSDGFEE